MSITHQQHLALEGMYLKYGPAGIIKSDADEDIGTYWELVRAGYLKNLALLVGNADWHFILTPQGQKYTQTQCKSTTQGDSE